MLDLSDALTATKALVEPTADPALTDQEVTDALNRTALASIWLPSTAYNEGDFVVPTVPMGRVFRCTLSGTSDTTEPQWYIAPLYTGPVNPYAGTWWGAGIVPVADAMIAAPWVFGLADGTCSWRVFSAFPGEIYDVRAAAAECFRLKAGKVANRVDGSIAGMTSARQSQMYTMFMNRALSLQPVRMV